MKNCWFVCCIKKLNSELLVVIFRFYSYIPWLNHGIHICWCLLSFVFLFCFVFVYCFKRGGKIISMALVFKYIFLSVPLSLSKNKKNFCFVGHK